MSIQSFDLIIFLHGQRLSALRVPISLSLEIYHTKKLQFQGIDYSGLEPLGDWLAVCDESPAVVGLLVTTIVQREVYRSQFLRSENLVNISNDLRIVFGRSDNVRAHGWPLTTVYSLVAKPNELMLYVPEFYSEHQEVPIAHDFPENWFLRS